MRAIPFVLFLLVLAAPRPVAAQDAAPAFDSTSARGEYLRNFDDASDKLIQLARAVPERKYTWRPRKGIRSFSEVLLHVAAGNFNLPRRFGAAALDDASHRNFETSTTDKARVIALLERSVDHVRQSVRSLSDADLDKRSPWLDNHTATYREIMYYLASHSHEHLGQLIAYSRMNNIVPPWSR